MSGGVVRISDAEREQAVGQLREHLVHGRLTLEEFSERMTTAYAATTAADLAVLSRDLPVLPAPSRRGPTRFLFSVFGSVVRDGRLRIRRRVACLSVFGSVDLDLRSATLEGEVITVFALGGFGAVDVYVPEGVEVDLHGLAFFGHKRANGNDVPPRVGTPLVKVYALALFAGIDIWRVPAAWTERTFREIIRATRRGEHKELQA